MSLARGGECMRYTISRRGRGTYTDPIDHECVFDEDPDPSQSIEGCFLHTALSHSGEGPGRLTARVPGRAKAWIWAISAWANLKSKTLTFFRQARGIRRFGERDDPDPLNHPPQDNLSNAFAMTRSNFL